MGQFSATRRAPAKGRGKGRGFGRPGKRQALNRAYQYLELVPKGRDEEAFKSPMEWVRRHGEYAAAGSLLPRWIKVVENAKVALNLNDWYGAYAIAHVGSVLVEETLLLLESRPQVNLEFAAI